MTFEFEFVLREHVDKLTDAQREGLPYLAVCVVDEPPEGHKAMGLTELRKQCSSVRKGE